MMTSWMIESVKKVLFAIMSIPIATIVRSCFCVLIVVSLTYGQTTYYVSSSTGNDVNNGPHQRRHGRRQTRSHFMPFFNPEIKFCSHAATRFRVKLRNNTATAQQVSVLFLELMEQVQDQ